MMVVVYRLPPAVGKMKVWMKKHCVKRVTRYIDGADNLCFWVCVALLSLPEEEAEGKKRIQNQTIVAHARNKWKEFYGKEKYERTYKGLFLDEIKDVSEKLQLNIFVYSFDCEADKYYLNDDFSCVKDNKNKNLHILHLENNESDTAHFLFVANPDRLTNSKICPVCLKQAFDMKNKNYKQKYDKHLEKCKANEGKIKKEIKLDKISKPFLPHIY
jgi:hypothetical protein